ncbi:hypothetical protein C8Q76DRAFT_796784 [Earliella scabrosa]|nr:hypothetical protein C8Q76DRAFT_796784 [Earliella scabrosa]
MATPSIASVSALLFKVHGTFAAIGRSARNLFKSTAQRLLLSHTEGEPLQTVTQLGAGLIDVFKAIHADVVVSPMELITDDTAPFCALHMFTVKNTGKAMKSFKITQVPAGTALTIHIILPALGQAPLRDKAASITVLPKSPDRSQIVTVVITPTKGLDAKQLPVFSGFLEITNGAESYHVTYLSVAVALKHVAVVDNTDIFFGVKLHALADGEGNFFTDLTNCTFVGDNFAQLISRLNFGAAKFRVDLVDPAIQLATALNTHEAKAEAEGMHVLRCSIFGFPIFSFPQPKGGSIAKVKTRSALFKAGFQLRNSEIDDRTDHNLLSVVMPVVREQDSAAYRLLLHRLKVTREPTKEVDFESWLSTIIGVQAP